MKIKMTKGAMSRLAQETDVELLLTAGWSIVAPPVEKKTAKSKSAEQTLDDTITQGDE